MIKPRIAIRPGRRTDARAVQRIVYGTLRSFGMPPDIDRWEAAIHRFGSNPPSYREVVLTVGGDVRGVAVLREDGRREAMLTDFYVDAGLRGQGLGTRLLRHAIALAREAGCRRIHLEARHEFLAAIHLYEKFGWVLERPTPRRRLPRQGPDRIYVLDLTRRG